jgi:hypothetical protein
LLGANDTEAPEGFLRRMDGLIEFSKGRGKSLVTPVLIGNQRAVQPVVLECALETSRAVADLLHTSSPSTPTNSVLSFTGSPAMALLQVSVRSNRRPDEICESLRLVAVKGKQ